MGDANIHTMKFQLKYHIPVQKNYDDIPKPLCKQIKEYVEDVLKEVVLSQQRPFTLHQL